MRCDGNEYQGLDESAMDADMKSEPVTDCAQSTDRDDSLVMDELLSEFNRHEV